MNKEERVIQLIEDLESTFEIRTFLDHDPYKVLIRTKEPVMKTQIRQPTICLKSILIFTLLLMLQLMILRN